MNVVPEMKNQPRGRRRGIGLWSLPCLLLLGYALGGCSYSFTWVDDKRIADCDPDEILDAAQQEFDQEDYEECEHLATYVREYFPGDPQVEQALYLAGESAFLDEEYWNAFKYFKDLQKWYRASQYLTTIADRYYQIGEAYLNRKPGIFGHLFTARGRGVQAMNHLITHFSHYKLADDAQMSIAEYYYEKEDYLAAADYYTELIKNYPASEWMGKAVFQLGMSYIKESKGHMYDREMMLRAWVTMGSYLKHFPTGNYINEAKENQAYIIEGLAWKELAIALFYLNQKRDFGARLHLSNAVILFPETKAGKEAQVRMIRNGWIISVNSAEKMVPRKSMSFLPN
jgi:outer membrane protein assembly factor BamD (BamD/ComL family)